MEYRCPLCLKELNASDRLVRYCTNFESKGCLPEIFECTPTNLQTKTFCEKCHKDFNEAEGVFLLHKSCRIQNPFVIHADDNKPRRIETGLKEKSSRGFYTPPDKGNNSPPNNVQNQNKPNTKDAKVIADDIALLLGESTGGTSNVTGVEQEVIGSAQPESTSTETIQFRHWILNFMRNLPTRVEINNKLINAEELLLDCFPGDEMWFPLALFRAITEIDEFERKCAAMVRLIGAKAVGKTIVATQSMTSKGYYNAEFMFGALAGNFILTQVDKGERGLSSNSMMADLCLNNVLLDSVPNVFLPEGTDNSLGTLKVTFFNKANTITNVDSDENTEKNKILDDETKESVKKGFAKVFSIAAELVGQKVSQTDAEKKLGKLKRQKKAQLVLAKKPFNYALIFYDTKGEHTTFQNAELKNIKDGTEKVAIFVSANEMLAGEGDSLRTANTELRGSKIKSPFCLVITKVDKLPEDSDLKKCLVELVESIGSTENENAVRQKLLDLLTEQIKETGKKGNIEELMSHLKSQDIKTFPIWTEGLSEDGKTSEVQPESFGMDKFVNWCFGFDIVG